MKRVYWFSWMVYTCAYVGRYNFSAAVAGIVAEGLFTKSQMGLVGTVFFIVYGSGQLINGFLGDKFSPYKMIFIGSFGSALANLAMCFSTSLPVMAIVWGLNGFAQSMLWSPIIYIVSNSFRGKALKKYQSYLPATLPIGSLIAYSSSMLLMKYLSWRYVFAVAALVLFVSSIAWLLNTASLGDEKKIESQKKEPEHGKKQPFLRLFVSSGVALMCLPVMLHATLKDGVMTWVPTMITELFSVTPSFSVMLTLALPIINFFGAMIVSEVYKRGKMGEVAIGSCFFAFALLPLIALLFISHLNAITSVVLLALITSSMVAINHVFLTLVPVRFATHGCSATMAGLLDSVAYFGSAISSYGFGSIAESIGWNKTIYIWVVIAVFALCFCLASIKRWEKFKSSVE